MIKAWFMFDNHTFAEVHITNRDDVLVQVLKLFEEDNYGMLGLHINGAMSKLILHGHGERVNKYGAKLSEIEAWIEKVFEEVSFQSMMTA